MPRYFFDISNGIDTVDDEGTVLSDVTEARRQGIAAAGAMVSDEGDAIAAGGTWTMRISDETRTVFCTIQFAVND